MKIAFIGKAGSGKSTLAQRLVCNNYIKLSFATTLKGIAEEIFMRPIDKTNPADRKVLQLLGTEVGRIRQKDIWIQHFDLLMNAIIEDEEDEDLNFVVDDCRFLNEAEYLKSKGFLLIKIKGRAYNLSTNSQHASEVEQDSIKCDVELDNSNDLETTIKNLYEIIEEYMYVNT